MTPVDRAAKIVGGCYDVHRILMEIHKAEREAAEDAIRFVFKRYWTGQPGFAFNASTAREVIKAYRKHLETNPHA